jgi:glycogen(starch) synthase
VHGVAPEVFIVKLLLYSHFFAPSVGGVETIVLTLARGLAELPAQAPDRRIEVTLATQTPSGSFDDRCLPFSVIRRPPFRNLWQLIRKSDLLHIAGPSLMPLLLANLARKPVVVEHHGFQTICPNGQLFMELSEEPCPGHFMANHHTVCLQCNSRWGWFTSGQQWVLTFVRRFLCSRVSSNIVPTVWLGNQLRLPSTVCLAHGLETISPVVRRVPTERPLLVFQGRLVSTKGVAVLLEAVSILKGHNRTLELLIIGDGPERAKLEQLARRKGLSAEVRFAGNVPTPQVEEMLNNARAVVIPSIAGEVFGLVAVENMLRAIPVIAADLGPFVEILGNTGLVFRTLDPVDLAGKIAKILDDPATSYEIGRLARQRALDSYDKSRMIDAHARLYESVVANCG